MHFKSGSASIALLPPFTNNWHQVSFSRFSGIMQYPSNAWICGTNQKLCNFVWLEAEVHFWTIGNLCNGPMIILLQFPDWPHEPDYHWLSLIIIDYHWLSWIIIGYHGLSLIATGYHWLSLEIYAAVQWLSSSNSLIDLMSLIGSTDLNQILYWSFGYLAFCEPAWPLTNLNHWPKRQIRDTNLWNCQLISDRNYSC